MLLRRRLTALIVSLVLLPSAASGRGFGCLMPAGGHVNSATGAIRDGHAAHVTGAGDEHRGHSSDAVAVSDDADNSSSRRSPHAPTECLSATACIGVALGAPSELIASALPRDAGVAADITLAPLSPASALEPPPPRA